MCFIIEVGWLLKNCYAYIFLKLNMYIAFNHKENCKDNKNWLFILSQTHKTMCYITIKWVKEISHNQSWGSLWIFDGMSFTLYVQHLKLMSPRYKNHHQDDKKSTLKGLCWFKQPQVKQVKYAWFCCALYCCGNISSRFMLYICHQTCKISHT